jgi:hypothetical protein
MSTCIPDINGEDSKPYSLSGLKGVSTLLKTATPKFTGWMPDSSKNCGQKDFNHGLKNNSDSR